MSEDFDAEVNRWEPGDDIPTVERSRSGIGRWKSYDSDVCTVCDIEFDDDRGSDIRSGKLREHIDEEHPRQCSQCDNIAAYWRADNTTYSSFCAKCLYEWDDPGPKSAWIHLDNPANADAPKLPADHPIEQAINGLYGDSSE